MGCCAGVAKSAVVVAQLGGRVGRGYCCQHLRPTAKIFVCCFRVIVYCVVTRNDCVCESVYVMAWLQAQNKSDAFCIAYLLKDN